MKIEEFDRRFCIILLIFMFLASLIIGAGLSGSIESKEADSIMAMGTVQDEIQTLMPENQAYDPVENAKEQMELERLVEEKGCIVVIPEATDTGDHLVHTQTESSLLRRYYQIPLNDEQQDKVFTLCDQYDVPVELVFGIIQADASRLVGNSSGHAVMSLNGDSSSWYLQTYGLSEVNDFDQNLMCGIIMLAEYYHRYPDVHKIAMCYEMGEHTAVELWSSGVTESEYSRQVAMNINTLSLRE